MKVEPEAWEFTFDRDDMTTLAWLCRGVLGGGVFGAAQRELARNLIDRIPLELHPTDDEYEQFVQDSVS